jgi:hypothetical protein
MMVLILGTLDVCENMNSGLAKAITVNKAQKKRFFVMFEEAFAVNS